MASHPPTGAIHVQDPSRKAAVGSTRTCNTVAPALSRRLSGLVVLSLAKARKDYYLGKVAEVTPREDYYLRGGAATGQWTGHGAATLGLSATVSAEGLARLFDGQHPATGEQLGRRLRENGVTAWDITFSADKSVSLLWALGTSQVRRHVEEAFAEATEHPKRLTADAVRTADVVITMGCGHTCPIFPGKRCEDWQLDDPAGQPLDAVRTIRDQIEHHVRDLITDLTQPSTTTLETTTQSDRALRPDNPSPSPRATA